MEAGTLIADRYRLDGLIAWGGMGAVWRGFDTRLDRAVGVKLLHRGLEEAQHPQDRFDREAKTLASLKGPGFAEIHDYGHDTHGGQALRYIVMELVEGVSLAELLHQRERLPAEEAMRIAAEAAEALQVAHRKGVVHRDIKPANLLIDADDRVRVIDFGIASVAEGQRLTSTDGVLGTAAYVSPEQLCKDEVTGAADLYALGAVAYECLTGAPPFDSVDREVIVHDHLWTAPPPLPEDIPEGVAAVVARSLRKSASERWESAEEMARACRAAIGGESAPTAPAEAAQEPSAGRDAAAPPSTPGRRRTARTEGLWSWRFGFVAVAVVALLLLTGLFAWSPWSQPDRSAAGESATAAEDQPGAEGPEASGTDEQSDLAQDQETGGPAGDDGDDPAEDGEQDGSRPDAGESTGDDESGGDSDQEAETTPPPSGSAQVPDVTGMTTFDARDELARAGFTNAVATVGYYWYTPEPEHCTVMQQTPLPGRTVDRSEQITLSYHERQSEGTSCEW